MFCICGTLGQYSCAVLRLRVAMSEFSLLLRYISVAFRRCVFCIVNNVSSELVVMLFLLCAIDGMMYCQCSLSLPLSSHPPYSVRCRETEESIVLPRGFLHVTRLLSFSVVILSEAHRLFFVCTNFPPFVPPLTISSVHCHCCEGLRSRVVNAFSLRHLRPRAPPSPQSWTFMRRSGFSPNTSTSSATCSIDYRVRQLFYVT